jgi:uncharacterized membrane protein YagU involved in acid resistance
MWPILLNEFQTFPIDQISSPELEQDELRSPVMRIQSIVTDVIAGAVAGLVATVPMTGVMLAGHAELPWHQEYPLPPRRITERVASLVGIHREMKKNDVMTPGTYVSHFGYGTTVGAIYGAIAPQVSARPAVKGIAYGLMVWSVSYLGLLPAAGLHRPATREPSERNLLMIAAHIVWGAALGLVHDRLSRKPAGQAKAPAKKRAKKLVTAGSENP